MSERVTDSSTVRDVIYDFEGRIVSLEERAAAAKSYTHIQSVPALVWVVDHGLGSRPVTVVYDGSGGRMIAEPFDVSVNQLEIHHNTPRTGRAECFIIS